MIDKSRFDRFQAMRRAMKEELKWRSAGPLRDAAALAALDLPGDPTVVARSLQAPADTLKQNAAGLTLLRQSTRYALAALLMKAGRDVPLFTSEIRPARARWKQARLRRGAPYEGAAHMVLMLGKPGSAEAPFLISLKNAFDDLKSRRYWQVGTQTIPPLALALQLRSDAAPAADAMYGAMKEQKGLHNRQTMEAALIATLSDGYDATIAAEIAALRGALKARKIPDAPAKIDTLALANLARPDPAAFADTVGEVRGWLKDGPHRCANAALLALSFVTAETLNDQANVPAGIIPLLMLVQTYLHVQEQQAAVIAVSAGGEAASAS